MTETTERQVPAGTIDLTELRAKGTKAVATAHAQAERTADPVAKARLNGRAEGINLVLSHLDEAVRESQADPFKGITVSREEIDGSRMNTYADMIAEAREGLARGERLESQKFITRVFICTGDTNCPARWHVHGCYADTDGTTCEHPEEHPAEHHPDPSICDGCGTGPEECARDAALTGSPHCCASCPHGGLTASCHAARDGECHWDYCPQIKDGEPGATGRHCPIDTYIED